MSELVLKYMYEDSRYTNNMIRAIHLISKHLTQENRFNLVKTCMKGIQKEREKHPEQTYRKGIANELAEMIGVDKNTVLRWMKWPSRSLGSKSKKGIQGNNKNIATLIMISLDYAKEETLKVLKDGLTAYYEAYTIIELEIENDVTFDYLR